MKLVKNIFIKIIWIILFIAIVFNIYNFISINILHKDLPTINGYALLEVVSGSMEPTIEIGDIIVINTKNQEYKKDDIITFYDVNGSFVTHRLVSISNDNMITKGDANDSEDDEMDVSNIVGKYVFKLNGLGRLMASLKNPFVMLLIMIIGIVLCLLMSTDKDLIPKDLTEEERAFLEYKRYISTKDKTKIKKKPKKEKNKDESEEKEEKLDVVIQEAEVIGEVIEVSVEELEEQENISNALREQLKEELRKELKEELRKEIQRENANKRRKRKKNNQNNNQGNNNNSQQKNNNKQNKKHQQQNKKKNNGNKMSKLESK